MVFAPLPDVFRTPFQTAPLDLGTDAFFPARRALVDARLQVGGCCFGCSPRFTFFAGVPGVAWGLGLGLGLGLGRGRPRFLHPET